MTPEHRFRIGSVTKIFVAALVLQLVDEGALGLDGDAGPIADGVTIRQLLNHTSGFPDFIDDPVAFFEPFLNDPDYRWELGHQDVLALVKEKPMLFPPGEGWEYHGSNYLMLGLIVEEATGKTLRDELQRRIFAPLGLAATDLPDAPPLDADVARGYFPSDNPVLPVPGPDPDVTDLHLPSNWAGGGIVSTPRDVARLLQALLGGELLPASLRTEMLRTVPSDWDETDEYGLGIGRISSVMRKVPSPCGGAWGHLGFSAGYTAIALSSEDGDRQAVAMANGDMVTDESWDALGRLVWAAYCG